MAITCPNCNTQLPDTAKFCINCGAVVGHKFHPIIVHCFLTAVETGNALIVEQILREDARFANIRDTTMLQNTALHHAVSSEAAERLGIMRLLILYGADVNATNENLETPLHLAASRDAAGVRLLLEYGADPNAGGVGTPLHYAVKYGEVYSQAKKDIIQTLFSFGANPNVQDASGNTPLHAAIQFFLSETEVSSLLCTYRADPTIATADGETPLAIAEKYVPPKLDYVPEEERTDEIKEIIKSHREFTNMVLIVVHTLRSAAQRLDEKRN